MRFLFSINYAANHLFHFSAGQEFLGDFLLAINGQKQRVQMLATLLGQVLHTFFLSAAISFISLVLDATFFHASSISTMSIRPLIL
jgi:hypothetical protein